VRRWLEHPLLIAVLTVGAGACDDPAAPFEGNVDAGGDAFDAGLEPPVDAFRCPALQVFPDLDGDGKGQRKSEGRPICIGEPVPAGFASEGGDCDDHDPQRFQEFCIDRDGDKAVVFDCGGSELPAGAQGCPVIVEATPEPGPYDCDDTNARLIDFGYRDADGDGVGAGEATCAPDEAGWSAWNGDCDDGDATRAPRKIERFGDGIDSDCDGSDENGCVPKAPNGFSWRDVSSQPVCNGIDLALGFVSCAGCASPQATFAIANRGASPVHADVVLSSDRTRNGAPLKFTIDLDVGEERPIVAGPFSGKFELQVMDPATPDCRLDNNNVSVGEGHCI
jgi:hypothetical protein